MTNYHKTWMNIAEFPNIFPLHIYIFNLKNKNVFPDSITKLYHTTRYHIIRRYN